MKLVVFPPSYVTVAVSIGVSAPAIEAVFIGLAFVNATVFINELDKTIWCTVFMLTDEDSTVTIDFTLQIVDCEVRISQNN